MRKKKIVVGNWKMNPETVEKAKEIFSKIKRKAVRNKNIVTIICPASVHLVTITKLAAKSPVKVGVQDVFGENQGYFTGQVSPVMSYNAGARYAILGHSEKRALGETDGQVAKKVSLVVNGGLTAIVCIGEKERDHDGNYLNFIKNELLSAIQNVNPSQVASKIIIAYEPIWAIGRSDMQAMKPVDVHQMSIFIKKVLNDAYSNEIAHEVPILYGGSVDSSNAKDIVYGGEVDGLLVGRMSLEPENFGVILETIN